MDQYSDEHVISGTAELAIGFLSCFLIVGLIIYFSYGRQHSKLATS